MRYHLVIDRTTGEMKYIGRNGHTYTNDEILDAHRRAATDDADAKAVLENIDVTCEMNDDPAAWLRGVLAHCPECRAAAEAGEQPEILGPAQLAELNQRGRRRWFDARRWRKRKQGP
jgi:hypothetical protein